MEYISVIFNYSSITKDDYNRMSSIFNAKEISLNLENVEYSDLPKLYNFNLWNPQTLKDLSLNKFTLILNDILFNVQQYFNSLIYLKYNTSLLLTYSNI